MKKIIGMIALIIFIQMTTINVFAAKVGEKVGKIYSTDIVAYVGGIPINSCNIGGKTGIVCEELKNYGFYVTWKGDVRKLFVVTNGEPHDIKGSFQPQDNKSVGKETGSIYSTDIVTYINGKRIPSYNIGGKTVVLIEDLGLPYGFATRWDGAKRTISADPYRYGGRLATDLGPCKLLEFKRVEPEAEGPLFEVYPGWLTLEEKTVKMPGGLIRAYDQEYLPLKDTLDLLGIDYAWDSENHTLKLTDIPEKITLNGEPVQRSQDAPWQTDDPLYMVQMAEEINGTVHPIMGTVRGMLRPMRYVEMPVVYKGTVYFPADALADYFDLLYEGEAVYITKKDDPYTWNRTSEYLMHVDKDQSELRDWITYTRPVNYNSGRGFPITEPYGRNEPIKIKFARAMDQGMLDKNNIAIAREYYSEEDKANRFEVISDQYDYAYDAAENLLTMVLNGDGLHKGDYVHIFLKNIADREGNHMGGIYQFMFQAE